MSLRMKQLLAILAAIVLLGACACAETETPLLTVNGEGVDAAAVMTLYRQLASSYAGTGYDTSDAEIQQMLFSYAMDQVIRDMLITQEMTRLGMYDFADEERATLQAQADDTYEDFIQRLIASYTGSAETAEAVRAECEATAAQYGLTREYTLQYVQNSRASQKYADYLMQGVEITDGQVQAAYESRVQADTEKYAQDAAAFETAITGGGEVWYKPEGYRSIVHILLKTDAETDEARLADVQDRLDAIYARLDAGEDFFTLVAEYGEESAFKDGQVLQEGYQVHRDSVIWTQAYVEAAFSDELQAPGDCSRTPLVMPGGVYILYYLKDSDSGAVELSDALRESLRQVLYDEMSNEKAMARAEELYAGADIQYNLGSE